MRISDWSSDVCSSDLNGPPHALPSHLWPQPLRGIIHAAFSVRQAVPLCAPELPPTGAWKSRDPLHAPGCETDFRAVSSRMASRVIALKLAPSPELPLRPPLFSEPRAATRGREELRAKV